ncbi:MAG: response regulator receiver protein [Polaromonas sp.]|jgi:two-component system OmpR family response regulator|nr:response regulator receiver protein [Polaromonas sp.]
MTLKVFLVEDSAAQCAYLTQILKLEADVDIVGIAETEHQAIDWLKRNPGRWDIALVDLYLGEGSGAGVIAHCQDRRADQGVLVMTNHAGNDGLLLHCKLLGADAVYHKATQLDNLVAYCNEAAARLAGCPA